MKLIFSVDALSPSLSGIGRYSWELAKRLPLVHGIEQVRYFRAGNWVNDPASLLNPAVPARRQHWKAVRWMHKWIGQRAFRGQMFHAPNYFLPPYAENGVATVHDLSVFKFPETHPAERIKQFEESFKTTLKLAKHLITDSETTRQEVMEFFGWPAERVTAVHLGVSPHFVPRSAMELAPKQRCYALQHDSYSLCVATIEPRKRIDRLLAAYECLPEKLRFAYPLVLVGGTGWCSERLHHAVRAGQNAGWLRYLGFVSEADLPALYAGARLFVYPSTYEGFGLPVAEAMASGVPVVSSNRSCMPEITAGAAKLVDPDDIEGFAAAIEEALTDANWRQEAIDKGLRCSSKYNWDECARRTVSVYANVLGEKG